MDAFEVMLAEHHCSSVSTRFYHFLDRREFESLAGLMAQDGVWMRQGKASTGSDAIREALAGLPVDRTTRHLVSNVVVTLLEDRRVATVAYDLSIFSQVGTGVPQHAGIFTGIDRLEHDGTAWRIKLKEASALFRLNG